MQTVSVMHIFFLLLQVGSHRRWDKRKKEPLRLVHRKVLRNWQVNCAMHAWAMPLRGERSTQDLTINNVLATPAQRFCHMSTLIADIRRGDAKREKE